jgi:cell division protein FtsL
MTRVADSEEYQRRIAWQIEEEDAELRRREQLDAELRRQQLEQQQREYAERMHRQAAERSGPELSL